MLSVVMERAAMGGEEKDKQKIRLTDADFHPHLRARMYQRGISREEIERTLNEGREVSGAKPGTWGKALVFPYNKEWEGQLYEEKEVTVYFRLTAEGMVLLTAIARYGKFIRRQL